MRDQVLLKEKHVESITPCNGLKVLPRSKKAEKVQKLNPIPSDGAKYMSYVKVKFFIIAIAFICYYHIVIL